MKMKKGKIYPSPSLAQPSSDDSLSVLKLLPATILVLVSVLSDEDREVLAYLITRGTTVSKKTKKKKESSKNHIDCECFDCYTSYWFRWDSSPNRELIHQIIEAFENHHLITANNKPKRGKKKHKLIHRIDSVSVSENPVEPVTENAVSDNSPERLSEDDGGESKTTAAMVYPAEVGHKGLARKVLPDVMGLFNSNFWKLWNPNA